MLSYVTVLQNQDGIYHKNTILKLELSSPHFNSGKSTEIYNVVVMEHKDDKLLSFAIDEFPDMTENAIERFSIEKVGLIGTNFANDTP